MKAWKKKVGDSARLTKTQIMLEKLTHFQDIALSLGHERHRNRRVATTDPLAGLVGARLNPFPLRYVGNPYNPYEIDPKPCFYGPSLDRRSSGRWQSV
jgi:hypothetical protein